MAFSDSITFSINLEFINTEKLSDTYNVEGNYAIIEALKRDRSSSYCTFEEDPFCCSLQN